MKKCYRPNVAIIVIDRQGRILACERKDHPGTWQIPQGGVDPGEKVEETAVRELKEEIGTSAGRIVGKLPKKIRYDWPKEIWRDGYCGQEQTYFLFQISPWARIDLRRGKRLNKGLKQEFRKAKFLSPKKFIKRIHGFKREAYIKALKQFSKRYPNLVETP